jgi:hypothetical protein
MVVLTFEPDGLKSGFYLKQPTLETTGHLCIVHLLVSCK